MTKRNLIVLLATLVGGLGSLIICELFWVLPLTDPADRARAQWVIFKYVVPICATIGLFIGIGLTITRRFRD